MSATTIPITDSLAVQRCLTWVPNPSLYPSPQPMMVNPHPPQYGNPRPVSGLQAQNPGRVIVRNRPISAPMERNVVLPTGAPTLDSRFGMLRETPVAKTAPYAPRYSEGRATIPQRPYCTLNDPHLYDFFVRKFMAMDPLLPSTGRNTLRSRRPGSAGGAIKHRPASGKARKKTKKEGEATYRVAVTTGKKRDAGTDAQVFVTIKGSKGRLPKRQLKKKSSGGPERKQTVFRFNKGTMHVFKFSEKDIGDIVSIVMEHDGVTEEEGWYLEQVEVIKKDNRTGKEKGWVFVCQNWLSLHEGDCQIRRELFTQNSAKTEYEVVVVTGNVKGAGTDAHVFLTLFGKTGQTPKLQLRSGNNSNSFERGQSDVFILKTNCVGPMTKLRIEHDNSGMAPGWFLDRVVVTDLSHPKWKYYFPCAQWLAKDEEDGQICRDLAGSIDPLGVRKMNQYKVSVYTGDKRGAGTDANVYITLFGEAGESAERRLDTKGKNDFERGQCDVFMMECPSLGSLRRLRIGHDNSGSSPGWFLDKVIVDDLDMGRVFEFPCGRWLAKDEDDGQTFRELTYGSGADAPPGVPYTIHVKTGDVANAGTSARVYIVMHGGKGGSKNSGKIWLTDGKFERGRTDIFNVEVAESLSPLSHIDIGHDNKGPGPGWFLDKVVVTCPSAGLEQSFRCGKWFAKDEGDRLIERSLYETGRKELEKTSTWFIRVFTADARGAGTDANVYLVAYGKNKKGDSVISDEIPLKNKGDTFEAGQEDKFKVEMAEIGRPYKIRVWHDDSKPLAAWKLDRIEMENMATKKHYTFICDRWLARNEDDGEIVRELPAEGDGIKYPEPVIKYAVSVHTGKKTGAGTDADVFLNIFGDQGDTGERFLQKSSTHKNKFEKGNVDEFIVEAVDLKKLRKIRIGHNGEHAGSGWFLDKVVIRPLDEPNKITVFECNRWLDTKEDDGLIVREITAGGSQMLNTTSYHVSVKTGTKRGAGTDANVFIKLFGTKGDTGTLQLLSADNNKNKFEAGRTDLFKLESTDIGTLKRIRIGHDGANPGAGWFLDEVRVDVPSKGESYIFACHRWLDKKEDDGQIEIEIEPTSVEKGAVRIPYEVTVWTGTKRGAGTDANVFLQMYGENGKTEEYFLRNRTDNFEEGQTDKFKIEAADVGPLLKIRVGHDGAGAFAGWFLDKILIQRHPAKGSKRRGAKKRSSSLRSRYSPEDDSSDGGLSVRGHRRKSDREADVHGRNSARSVDRELDRRSSLSKSNSKRHDDDDDDDDYDKYSRRPSSRDGKRHGEIDKKGGRSSLYDNDEKYPRSSSRSRHHDDDDDDYYDGKKPRKGVYDDDDDDDRGRRRSSSRGSHRGEDDYGRRSPRGGDSRHTKDDMRRRDSRSERHDDERPISRNSRHGDSNRHSSLRHHDDKYHDKDKRHESDDDDRRRSTRPQSAHHSRPSSRSSINGRRSTSDDEDRGSRSPRGRHSPTGRHSPRGHSPHGRRDEEGGRRSAGGRRSPHHKSRYSDEDEDERKGGKDEVEEYWFVCQRWFAKNEDDHKIVRELVPTTEDGQPLDTGLEELEYIIRVFTGDKRGAGTDANIFVNITGEFGDTGERQLKESDHVNKFERNQVDEFRVSAVELGKLKKLKIRHDNKGGGAAWFLGHVEVEDPKNRKTYYFPCQRWLATNEDDGQIARVLIPIDKNKIAGKDDKKVRDALALEQKAMLTTYHVNVFTGDKFGAGTDANVYCVLYGELDDTGLMYLKHSKTNRNKFERNQMDEFVIEAVDIGELKKIKIGHDNAGGGGAWFLDRVEIDSPSLGKKWFFPHGRWLAKDKDDGKLERELYPQDVATEEYNPCIPYEITTYTSEVKGAGTEADVYIVLFGRDESTSQKSLCKNKAERKDAFKKGAVTKFVIELEDVGELEKLRIGHDGKGIGAGWHLDKVEVKRLKNSGKGSQKYIFPCGRWMARDEEDGSIERELVPREVIEEVVRRDGSVKTKELERRNTLTSKNYTVNVVTGVENGAGTDANVFLNIIGEHGDCGERQLKKSETNRDKFEKGQTDRFIIEAVDLGKPYKVKIRHDNSNLSPAWFLDRVEVIDPDLGETYTFHCERWLAKNKDDGKLERTLYVEGYRGDLSSGTLHSRAGNQSNASLDSARGGSEFGSGKSPRVSKRQSQSMEDIPEGPTVSYTIKISTGSEKDAGTDSPAWIKIYGSKKKHTGRQYLNLSSKKAFKPGSVETFSLEAVDVEDVKQIELGHDGVVEGSGWYVNEVEIDMPTKGKHYYFPCRDWLAKDKGDGHTNRIFSLSEGDASVIKYKPMIPYEATFFTGNVSNAGTDARIFIKAFGQRGATADISVDKAEDRFERGQADLVRLELEDVGALKKLRVGHDARGQRPDWFLDKIEMRNMMTGDLYVFNAGVWFSRTKDDKQIVRDFSATVHGKTALKLTSYKISVKTSEVRGAGTDANVFVVLFGENGDSGELHLRQSETNRKPFETGQTDIFTIPNILSLGHIIKVRVWHDNKGFGAAWHLDEIDVLDESTDKSYSFPCARWLSKSEDDKQICRELVCANLPNTTRSKDKITYQIEVTTSEDEDAWTVHNAWLILEGSAKSSQEFVMENGRQHRILRSGQTDLFVLESRDLGKLKRCILGGVERDDRDTRGRREPADLMWHCKNITVTNEATGDRYVFECNDWIKIRRDISIRHAKVLPVTTVDISQISAQKDLGTVKYDVTVVTGDKFGCGTNANVFITIYGEMGDSGKRPLTQKFRDLFERNQTDTFQIEAIDLGDLKKIKVEHDNSGFNPGWLLDRVEITDKANNRSWVFPCNDWLDKKNGLSKELYKRS